MSRTAWGENMEWVKYKTRYGIRHHGDCRYSPSKPFSNAQKILGMIARCEGNYDTVVSFDGTGVTWGFIQWTFTSGRLQHLIKFIGADGDKYFKFGTGKSRFLDFDFDIVDGRFVQAETGLVVVPNSQKERKLIDDICMGRTLYKSLDDRKIHASCLAEIFAEAGKDKAIQKKQEEFAWKEIDVAINVKRAKALPGIGTIGALLNGELRSPLAGVFFNLWTNNPQAAYKLYMKSRHDNVDEYFKAMWHNLKNSQFGNWSYAKPENKSPRIKRVISAVQEFYGLDLGDGRP